MVSNNISAVIKDISYVLCKTTERIDTSLVIQIIVVVRQMGTARNVLLLYDICVQSRYTKISPAKEKHFVFYKRAINMV